MWLLISIIGYFLNAGVYVADKHFLSKKIHSSIAYAFYVGIWSIGNIVFLWWSPFFPVWPWLIIDLAAGLLFLWALIAWYKALHQSDATKVVPIVGAFVPIFSFILSYIFFGHVFTQQEFLAFLILLAGGILISIKRKETSRWEWFCDRVKILFGSKSAELHPVRRLIINSVISAFIFAAYYVLIKYIYLNQPFLGSFVWTRVGSFLGALLLILPERNWKIIFEPARKKEAIKNLPLFLVIRFIAVVAFILINYAISLGNVALVNALQGAQYLFLIVIVLFLSKSYPDVLKEEMDKTVLTQKLIGVMMVGVGLYLLM
ncbi:MAG: EamA family transporter [Patescibacteria group bacterium]